MYVCLCHGITDKAIKQAVTEDGVGNMRQLRETLGVGSSCGKCVPMAQSMIDSTIIDESLFREVC
ncbi:MAG: bacterioferritin-associated ferredoxin [Paraglaciecola sp.]|jgi:bacterioferritin-associated ferredoxin